MKQDGLYIDVVDVLITLYKIQKMISDTGLTLHRAENFKKYAHELVKMGDAGLAENKEATKKIQTRPHNPLYFTGDLMSHIRIQENNDNSVEVGFFGSDTAKPSQSKITYTQIALLQSSGFRIPLTGAKGKRVRGWLSQYKIFPRKTRSFLIVKPRPFFYNIYERYESHGKDYKSTDKYLSQLWRRL